MSFFTAQFRGTEVKQVARCPNRDDQQNTGRTRHAESTRSVTRGLPVFARFAGANVDTLIVVPFYFDGLVPSVASDIKAHIMPASFQIAHCLIGNATFHVDVA